MRLFDLFNAGLLKKGPMTGELEKGDIELFRSDECHKVVIDYAADYYWTRMIEDGGYDNVMENMLSLVPPFPVTWFEYRIPHKARRVALQRGGYREYGNVVITQRQEYDEYVDLCKKLSIPTSHKYHWDKGCSPEETGNKPKWVVYNRIIQQYDKRALAGPYWECDYYLDAEGKVCDGSFLHYDWYRPSTKEGAATLRDTELLGAAEGLTLAAMIPVWLGISFMHCKNVSLAEIEPPAPLSKRWQKEYNKPLTRYKVLSIKQVGSSGKRIKSDGGIKKASPSHVCRGHYKDYRESGLFGKLHGVYWWDAHLRGNENLGKIIKTYQVEGPN